MPVEPLRHAPPAPEPERRRVTVLFADLVGFANLAEGMDPEDLHNLMTETFGELVTNLEARSGWVEKFIGDAILSVFGLPIAHEDDPLRAVAAAFDLFDTTQRLSEAKNARLQLRIGINSGLVVAGGVGDGTQQGVMGDAVNVAARLQQAAEGGQLLVSASVWRRIRDRYEGEHLAPLDVKGRDKPVDVYVVTGKRADDTRRRAPFVGRTEERALLELLWSSAVKGNTHVVSVVGEPGVGKSRLLTEFHVREDHLDVRIQCGGERAFGVFLDLAEALLGRLPRDADDLELLTASVDVEKVVIQQIGALLGVTETSAGGSMADEHQMRQVFTAVWKFLLAVPRGRPVLFVLEDLHWADQSSLDLLQYLLERIGGAPMMFALSYRPGFDRLERWTLRPSHMGIRLDLLTAQESVDLAKGYLGVAALPADLERLVATRAEGNPFFIEELLQALLELGSLAVVDGQAVLAKVHFEIPDTVEGTILARIDGLPPRQRSLLQFAAVLGRTFSSGMVQALAGEDDVVSTLEELARAQLLMTEGPEEWSFRHALIHDVAYETILLRQRKDLHRRVALALAEEAGEDPTVMERLAEHYARAEDPEEARRHALKAGDLARERFGFAEARRHYETALRLWGTGDEQERLGLLMKLAWASHLAGDRASAMTALIEAEAGYRDAGKTREAGSAMAIQGRLHFFGGETERADQVLGEAIRLLEPHGSSPEIVQAMVYASAVMVATGNVAGGTVLAAKGLRMAEELGLDAAQSSLLTSMGVLEVLGGDPTGEERIRRALGLAEQAGEVEALGRAYLNLGIAMRELGANREGLEVCRRGREAMRRVGAPNYEGVIVANEACMLVDLGRGKEGEESANEVLGPLRTLTNAPALMFAGQALATSLLRRGRWSESRAVLDEIVPMARRARATLFVCPILSLESELEHARGNLASARRSAEEAIRAALEGSAAAHLFRPLVRGARLGFREGLDELLDEARHHASHPLLHARLTEAEAAVSGDRDLHRAAADLYRRLELPYDEARCRLDAGQTSEGRALIHQFGYEESPLRLE